MTTTTTVTVGLGKTYSTLNDLQTNYPNKNLVSQDTVLVAECYSGANLLSSTLTFAGWTTDATRYIDVRAATGEEHQGVYNTSKAYGYVSGNSCVNTSQYVKLNKMQFRGTNTPNAGGLINIASATVSIDRCFILGDGTGQGANVLNFTSSSTAVVTNSIILYVGSGIYSSGVISIGSTVTVYNCTVVTLSTDYYTRALGKANGNNVTSQNNYLHAASGYMYGAGGGTECNKGANDATSNAEAVTSNLRNVPYSTATFLSVTLGSENLRPVVSQSNKLLDNGANLTGSGVTTDIIGTARPQFGAFDIGAFENDIPICWSYVARYRGSQKLFKASGCGSFPKTLRVPSNVDKCTGRMVDDGIEVDPSEYEII